MTNTMAFAWIYPCDVLLKYMLQFSRPDSVLGADSQYTVLSLIVLGSLSALAAKCQQKARPTFDPISPR